MIIQQAPRTGDTLGVFAGIPETDYHAGPGVSKTQLHTLLTKSPDHMRNGEKVQTKAMAAGKLIHAAVLEPESFDDRYAVAPIDAPAYPTSRQWNAKKPSPETIAAMAFWRSWEAANAGKIKTTIAEVEDSLRIRDKLQSNPLIRNIVASKPQMEHSAYWIDEPTGALCRCRPDLRVPGLLGDLKKIENAAGDAPIRAIESYGYDMQAAYYPDGWLAATNENTAFLFIFIEPTKPYGYRLIEPDGRYIDIGRASYRRALNTYAECLRRNEWPGYSEAIETVSPRAFYEKTKMEELYRE